MGTKGARDDILSGSDDEEEVIQMYHQLISLFAGLGMGIHKFATNSQSLFQSIPEEKRSKQVTLEEAETEVLNKIDKNMPTLKCLGILYNPDTDSLQFLPHEIPDDKVNTKRQIISYVARVFDPLGLVSPLVLLPKLLAQSLWKIKGLDWDDPAPAEVLHALESWAKTYLEVHKIHIPRHVKTYARGYMLAVFCDASDKAQAACAYMVSISEDGERRGCLWASKQRLTSISKNETIARKELIAAVMGVKLALKICQNAGIHPESVKYLTDSTTVLWWLRSTKELSIYCANRVCQIKELSLITQWYHVRTLLNAADIPTRGMAAEQLAKSILWWTGGILMTMAPEDWPQAIDFGNPESWSPDHAFWNEDKENSRKVEEKGKVDAWMNVGIGQDASGERGLLNIIHNTRGDLFRRIRVAGRVIEALCKMKDLPVGDTFNYLLTLVFRHAQEEDLAELKTQMLEGKRISGKFAEMNPVVDTEGTVRAQGRLRLHQRLELHKTEPPLLTAASPWAEELVATIHAREMQHTGGRKALMGKVRNYCWIVGLNTLARRVLRNCPHCRKRSKLAARVPTLAPLHWSRLPKKQEGFTVFTDIGVDLCGPYRVKADKGYDTREARRKKRPEVIKKWIMVVSCNLSRSLSLETVAHEDVKAAHMALERHCSVWGTPDTIACDRGTNWVGLKADMDEQWEFLQEVANTMTWTHKAPTWHLNPAYSASFGGSYESLVKIVRNSISKLLPTDGLYNIEQFETIVKKTQQFANDRPLVEASADVGDFPDLRPADLMGKGKRFKGLMPLTRTPELVDYHRHLRNSYKILWDIFYEEYVHKLTRVYNNRANPYEFKEGEVVHLITEERTTPIQYRTHPSLMHSAVGRYRIGIIRKIHLNSIDLHGRVFVVEHQDGSMRTMSYRNIYPVFE